jgi:hypothetical protein
LYADKWPYYKELNGIQDWFSVWSQVYSACDKREGEWTCVYMWQMLRVMIMTRQFLAGMIPGLTIGISQKGNKLECAVIVAQKRVTLMVAMLSAVNSVAMASGITTSRKVFT